MFFATHWGITCYQLIDERWLFPFPTDFGDTELGDVELGDGRLSPLRPDVKSGPSRTLPENPPPHRTVRTEPALEGSARNGRMQQRGRYRAFYGGLSMARLRNPPGCAPCFQRTCSRKDHSYECLERITPQLAIQTIQPLISLN